MGEYSLADVSRICGVPRQRLRYWQRTRLLEARRFEFRDLVRVRRLNALLEQGVSLQRIRTSLDQLRRHAPELEDPLGSLRAAPTREGHVVLSHAGALVEPDGQLVLDLASEAREAEPVALSERRARDPERQEAVRQQAERWFERGCRLDSDRATRAEAIDAYQKALMLVPDYADALCNLGTVYYNQDRRGHARACFERALASEPNHLETHLNLGALMEEEGRFESALSHLKLALAVDPLCADTHVSLALLYERLDLRGLARDHWRRSLQLDPLGEWADVARRHLEEGRLDG